jgi:hypothetical protein
MADRGKDHRPQQDRRHRRQIFAKRQMEQAARLDRSKRAAEAGQRRVALRVGH